MIKKNFIFVFLFVSSLSVLSGERFGNLVIEEGMPLPIEQGVLWEYGESGYARVFIWDDQFVAVFLDSQKKVRAAEDIHLVTVNARYVVRGGSFSLFHLKPSEGGLYFSNPRHVYRPYIYDVEVYLRKETKRFPRYRGHKFEERYIKETLEVRLLDQSVGQAVR